MPVANQYGIDMGNILSTVSNLKTAQQERGTNAIRQDMLSRQNKEDIATNQAEKDYLNDHKTAIAHTVAQKLQWGKLDDEEKLRAAAAMKDHINKRGVELNSIIGIQDPAQQKEALLNAISNLTPEEQAGMSKYGNTVDEWQQNLPHMMNDLLVAYGGVALLQKQAEEKTKHENKLEEVNALYSNKNVLLDKTLKNKLDVANLNVDSKEAIAKYKASHPTTSGKPTVLEMKAAALVDSGEAKDINEGIRMVMKSSRTTDVQDPVMGNKHIVSTSSYGKGDMKAPPPLLKVNSREQAIKAIKAKYPKATQRQIDTYLKSKGL